MKLTKYAHNPILAPAGNNWESLAVCNPGAWYEDGTFYLLYRAAGDDPEHRIHLGLATSADGFNFVRESDRPVFSPSVDGPDAGCVEDPRIVKLGGAYYITYAYRPYPPGRYWLNPGNEADCPAAHLKETRFLERNLTNSGLAVTEDFRTYKRIGRMTQAGLDDRDVILFPEQVNGQYVMLHRPKEWVGEAYGTDNPAIWISYSDDILTWKESTLLIKAELPWETKIGGSTPPLKTDRGWLVLYHGVDAQGVYRVGVIVLDLNDTSKVIARPSEYIMEPEFDYEWEGPYQGVVFPTGNVIVDDTLYVYYGGADKYCAVATCSVTELLDFAFGGEREQ